MKIGHTGTNFIDNRQSFTNDQQLAFRLNNGVPNQLTEAVPFVQLARARIFRPTPIERLISTASA